MILPRAGFDRASPDCAGTAERAPACRSGGHDAGIDLAPCGASCARRCACSRRALRALLVSIGLAGGDDVAATRRRSRRRADR